MWAQARERKVRKKTKKFCEGAMDRTVEAARISAFGETAIADTLKLRGLVRIHATSPSIPPQVYARFAPSYAAKATFPTSDPHNTPDKGDMAMPIKFITAGLLSAALAAPLAIRTSDAPETVRKPAKLIRFLVETPKALAPADVMFGRSLHVTQTDSFARDGRHYLAMRAPTRSALDAFLQGTGRATAPVTQ